MNKAWPTISIDHINQVRDDNRIQNLREVSRSENQQNRGMSKNNNSGFKGISWHKKSNKWQAQIHFQGKRQHLGLFHTPEEASAAYQAAAEKFHTHRPIVNNLYDHGKLD